MKIQLDIPEDLNKKLKILKAQKGFKNLQETIIYLILEYGKRKE